MALAGSAGARLLTVCRDGSGGFAQAIREADPAIRERWQQVHSLLGRAVSTLECARRLDVTRNTVKRSARRSEPDRVIRAPVSRSCLVDPYRDHLRQRRTEDPAIPVTHLLAELREQGYTGSANLLVRYSNQGGVESAHAASSPRKVSGLFTRHPNRLDDR
ncbi:hypothetical protein GCM10010372_50800 [Streptomyces tauricus]|uniref:hypothetical protein n=1 Tax=Streptomyces tauricus TaxID=68274 RepID=UPI00198C83DF|nr:hypothetical protein [Streptomyces tauricus]GHA44732.1 hypothetical protein GCM10010372_50800 [Streptomyces tauricus]